jgi:iron complex outermembrane receptor protein
MLPTSRQITMKALLGSTSVCIASFFLQTSQAHAQTAAPAAADQSATGSLGDIIVTAQRRSENLRDVPISITAQSGADLARQGVTNMQELSVAVPGLSFTKLGAWAQPTIRGVQTSIAIGGADAPVAIYLDGTYRPNQVGNLFDLPDVERIEVLKGPQGTLFGRNATGGAILIHTLEPSFDGTTGKISVSDGISFGGSAKTSNEIAVKGFVSMPISDSLAFSVSGYFSRDPGYMTNDVTGNRYGLVRTFMTRGKLLFQPSDRASFLLSAMYSNTKDANSQTFFPLDGLAVGGLYPGNIIPSKPWHFASELRDGTVIRTSDFNVSLRGEVEVGEAGSLKSITSYSRTNPLLVVDADGTYSPGCVAVRACATPFVAEYGPQKTFQQELTFSSQPIGMMSFIAGLLYYHDRHNGRNNVGSPIAADGTVDPDVDGFFAVRSTITTTAYAGFGEVSLEFSDRLRLIGGIRYSWERKVGEGAFFKAPKVEFTRANWDAWTPRLSVLFEASSNVNLYATYSKGFKSGILDSSALTVTPVKPETLTSYEVGIKASSRNFSIAASAFYYDYKNVQLQFRRGVINLFANAEGAELYGFDLDATVKLSQALQWRIGGSWLPRARYKSFIGARAFDLPMTPFGLTSYDIDASGTRMLRASKLTATSTLAYSDDISWGRLDASGTLYYSAGQVWDVLHNIKSSPYVLLNARLALTPTGSPLTFGIFGKNLTNKVYFDSATPSQYANNVHFGRPRQVGVTIDYAF